MQSSGCEASGASASCVSLDMAVTMSLIGTVQNVWQLLALRLLAGMLGGLSSAAVVLVATQTPKDRSGWASGTLSTSAMTGSLIGPLIGRSLPSLIGVRETFYLAGGIMSHTTCPRWSTRMAEGNSPRGCTRS